MPYVLKKIGNAVNIPYRVFECDNESDLAGIDIKNAPMGSRCYVINSGKWFALNSEGKWKTVPGNSGGDIPSDPDVPQPGDTIIYNGGEEVE